MPSNAFIFIALIAGFLFLRAFSLTRLDSRTWNGPLLIFWSGLLGFVLLGVARYIIVKTRHSAPNEVEVIKVGIHSIYDTPYLGTYLLALTLSLLIPLFLNIIWPVSGATFITRNRAGLLRGLFIDALRNREALAIALKDNKVYVGFVISSPTLSPSEEYFRFLPTLSGYRDPTDKRFNFTTPYEIVARLLAGESPVAGYKKEDLEEFEVVLPYREVLSARIFDEAVYQAYFQGTIPGSAPIAGPGSKVLE